MAPVANPPVVLMIPVGDLIIPELNPRKTVKEGPLLDLMAHIQAGGHVDRIQVWGGDGKSVISGQRRLLAYRRLGKTHIEAEILDISLEEARKKANTSNQGEPLYWLEQYIGWEPDLAPGLGLTDEQAAAAVGTNADWIGRARKLLSVLSPISRRLIQQKLEESPANDDAKNKGNNDVSEQFGNIKKPLKKRMSENPEKWELLERTAFELTAFWNKRSLQDVQALVEKALPVILSHQMNGPQVKALVKWMSAGNAPEAFEQQRPPLKKGEEKGVLASELKPTTVPNPEAPTPHAQVAASIVGNILGKQIKQAPGHMANRVIPGFNRIIHAFTWVFQKIGVKNLNWATVLVIFLALLVGSTLISYGTRFIGRVFQHMVYSWAGVSQPAVSQPNSSNGSNGPSAEVGATSASLSIPTQNSKLNTQNSQGVGWKRAKPPVAVPPAWAADGADFATDIAGHLFNLTPDSITDNMEWLKNHMPKSYFPTVLSQYYGPAFFKQIMEQNLVYVLQDTQAEFLRMEGGSGVFLVKGEQSKQRGWESPTSPARRPDHSNPAPPGLE